MKHVYKKPTMKVVLVKNQAQLLAGSYRGKLNAPVFEWDDDKQDDDD